MRLGIGRRRRAIFLRTLIAIAAVVVGSAGLSACHGGVHAQAVITGLDNSTSFTVDPDNNHIWYAERFSGEIRRRNLSTGEDRLVWTVSNVLGGGEQGLFGLALHPNYPATQQLFAFATRSTGFGPVNQVVRITLSGGVGVSAQPIFSDSQLPGMHHVGGRILFGPDGQLYVSLGDHTNRANSQNLNALPGKVHRMTTNGAVPAGNPVAGKTLWAFGLRNSFGFDFDPVNNQLWLTDNGPTCNDEVNRIVAGGNHAWGPSETCATPPSPPANTNQDGPAPRRLPEHFYGDSTGMTGVAFCGSCGLGSERDNALFVGAGSGMIHQLTLNSTRTDVASDVVAFDHTSSVLSIETRPDKPIYFSDFGAIYKLTLAG